MEFERMRNYLLNKLENNLPKNLFYHSIEHIEDVFQSAEQLAKLEGIEGEDLILLRTAVLFHDAGFMVSLQNHEANGCEIAKVTLPDFGFSEEQIKKVCGMILSTKIPQSPKNKLEEIICDADLDYLGRDDFWEIGNKLFEELKIQGILKNEVDWNKLQLGFLQAHNYFTVSANTLRKEKKLIHFKKIKNIVESYTN